jgi:hypothetical protein
MAILRGHVDVVKALLDAGLAPNVSQGNDSARDSNGGGGVGGGGGGGFIPRSALLLALRLATPASLPLARLLLSPLYAKAAQALSDDRNSVFAACCVCFVSYGCVFLFACDLPFLFLFVALSDGRNSVFAACCVCFAS